MRDDIVFGKKGNKVVVRKKDADDFALAILNFRNDHENPQTISELVSFIKEKVTDEHEEDRYEDVYDKLQKDIKRVKESMQRMGIGNFLYGLLDDAAADIGISINGHGKDWTDKFYAKLQRNTEYFYQLANIDFPIINTASDATPDDFRSLQSWCRELINSPEYRWYKVLASNPNGTTNDVVSVSESIGCNPMNLDARRVYIKCDGNVDWHWEVNTDEFTNTKHYVIDKQFLERLKNEVSSMMEQTVDGLGTAGKNVVDGARNAVRETGKIAKAAKEDIVKIAERVESDKVILKVISRKLNVPLNEELCASAYGNKVLNFARFGKSEINWLKSVGDKLVYSDIMYLTFGLVDSEQIERRKKILIEMFPTIGKSYEDFLRSNLKPVGDVSQNFITAARNISIIQDIANVKGSELPNELVDVDLASLYYKGRDYERLIKKSILKGVDDGWTLEDIRGLSGGVLNELKRLSPELESLLSSLGDTDSVPDCCNVVDVEYEVISEEDVEVLDISGNVLNREHSSAEVYVGDTELNRMSTMAISTEVKSQLTQEEQDRFDEEHSPKPIGSTHKIFETEVDGEIKTFNRYDGASLGRQLPSSVDKKRVNTIASTDTNSTYDNVSKFFSNVVYKTVVLELLEWGTGKRNKDICKLLDDIVEGSTSEEEVIKKLLDNMDILSTIHDSIPALEFLKVMHSGRLTHEVVSTLSSKLMALGSYCDSHAKDKVSMVDEVFDFITSEDFISDNGKVYVDGKDITNEVLFTCMVFKDSRPGAFFFNHTLKYRDVLEIVHPILAELAC